MEKLAILSIVYFIGLIIFLLTGLCELNWLYLMALALGIIGTGYIVFQESRNKY